MIRPEVTRVIPLGTTVPGLAAYVVLTYGPITIKSARLMRTSEGCYFLSMASKKAEDGRWHTYVDIEDRNLLREFESLAIRLYEEALTRERSSPQPTCPECGVCLRKNRWR